MCCRWLFANRKIHKKQGVSIKITVTKAMIRYEDEGKVKGVRETRMDDERYLWVIEPVDKVE